MNQSKKEKKWEFRGMPCKFEMSVNPKKARLTSNEDRQGISPNPEKER